jgi:hypothetical protein
MRKLNFLIVGAPKCGTTALHAFLGRHPEIFLPAHKEPHFFGSDLDFRDQPRPNAETYAALFAGAAPDQRIGEASVFYLYSRCAAQEIQEHNPSIQIIIALRNPVDAMYSFHSQRLYNGTEDVADFEQALELEEERKRGRRLPRNVGLRQGLFYRELMDFPPQVERYYETFGRDRVRVVLHDDLAADPAYVYRDLCGFIGVDPTFETVFETVNPNKRARLGWLRNQLWKPSPWARKTFRQLLPDERHRARFASWLRSWNTIYEPRRPLDPRLRERLLSEAAPGIKRLEFVIDRDLRGWLES